MVNQAKRLHLKTAPWLDVKGYVVFLEALLNLCHLFHCVGPAASDHLYVVHVHACHALARLQNWCGLHLAHDLVGAVLERLLHPVGDGLVGEVQRPRPAHAHGGHAGVEQLPVLDLGLGPLGVVPDRGRSAAHALQLVRVEAVLEAKPGGELGDREIVKAVPDVALQPGRTGGCPGAHSTEARSLQARVGEVQVGHAPRRAKSRGGRCPRAPSAAGARSAGPAGSSADTTASGGLASAEDGGPSKARNPLLQLGPSQAPL
eukprot:278398-Pyramimonas_sp.AAC.1